jgi:hypothetical protein
LGVLPRFVVLRIQAGTEMNKNNKINYIEIPGKNIEEKKDRDIQALLNKKVYVPNL